MASRAVYGPGAVANYLGCAPRTAQNLIDSGAIRGYIVPGGRSRRVPRVSLAAYLATRGDYLDLALAGAAGPDSEDFRSLAREADALRSRPVPGVRTPGRSRPGVA